MSAPAMTASDGPPGDAGPGRIRRAWARRPRWQRWLTYAIAGGLLAFATLLVAVGHRVRLIEPAATVVLHDRDGRFLGEPGTTARLGFWPVDPAALPHRVVAATLAIEDRRFWDHPGVDAKAIARAVAQNVSAGRRISGASTIAMQVARLQDPAARTWSNKLLEAATALRLVRRYGRARVLAQYLRLAPYGNNVHGIGYAARRYFDKPVADLSWAETAFLSGLPQAPGLMSPYSEKGRDRAKARARRILDLLLDRGRLDRLNHGQAARELTALTVLPRPTRPDATLHPLFAFERRLEALRPTLGTDLRVRTTLDLPLQAAVQARMAAALEEWSEDGAGNVAAVVVDVQDGLAVRAAVGSADWHDTERAGALDFTRVRRAPGSTLKPFLYAMALERGHIAPDTVLDDLLRAGDGIGNSDGRFLGPMLPRTALANSRNVPAVELAERVGLGAFHAVLGDLGLHRERFVGRMGAALAIGGLPVRLVDLVRAYGPLATDGALRDLRWHARQPVAGPRRIFTAQTAAALRLWLSDPMARLPTFPRGGHLELPFAVAAKTGTTGDYRDAWAVMFSDRYLVGLWVGHPAWRPMRGLSGYKAAALARDILRDLHRGDRLSDVGFAPPGDWQAARVCPLTGRLAGPACEGAFDEHFTADAMPHTHCESHVQLPSATDGTLTGPDTPGARLRTFVTLPARYAEWMRRVGLEPPPGDAGSDPGLLERRTPRIRVLSPKPGSQLIIDPDAPPEASTVRLQAAVDPPVEQVVWFVDGRPVAVADPPYVSRWPLEPGAHWIEARLPFSDVRSPPVRVLTR